MATLRMPPIQKLMKMGKPSTNVVILKTTQPSPLKKATEEPQKNTLADVIRKST